MEILPYRKSYKRDTFSCGQKTLDNYILRNATKDVKSGSCTCFVTLNNEDYVIGYYTLSSHNISIEHAPEAFKKSVKYDFVPTILLGRLAVDETQKGKGFGKLLLVDSLKRSLDVARNQIGSVAVIADPIDASAIAFYAKYGFTMLPDSGKMFMTIKKIEEAFNM